jgi:hypothetical protein
MGEGHEFKDDVIKVMSIYDAFGREITLNDRNNKDSAFTPTPKVLRIPRAVPGVLLSVTYQAKHPPLTLDDLEVELELPEVLYSALTAFVGWRIYKAINTQEAQAISEGHHTTYENECMEAVRDDSVNTSISTTNIVFHQRGWR